MRATDNTGAVQTADEASPVPDGATGWHTVSFAVKYYAERPCLYRDTPENHVQTRSLTATLACHVARNSLAGPSP